MAAVIQDSVAATEKLVSFQNSGVEKASILGNGTFSGITTISDSNGLNRVILNPTAKTIVDGAATALFTVPVAQGAAVGGVIDFFIYASDGTDQQVISGFASFASVNKAGTLTNTITQLATTEAKAVSAGTLTLSWTMAEDSADVVSVKLTPTGSLTETVYQIVYNIRPLRGVVTIV
jgi:hypothetical protein